MFKPTRRFAGVARTVVAGLLVGAFALGMAACGDSDDEGEKKDTTAASTAELPEGVALNDEEFKQGADIFFRQCAGCHGALRVGATGPPLQPKDMQQRGTAVLEAIITNGLPGGMPPWGKAGFLSPDEVSLMARFLQMEPPEPPGLDMDEIKESWDLKVPVADRPTAPQTTRNWQNFIGVILRDAGKVAIMDGDTKERVALLDTGYAVHILRSSKTGRYFYTIGRDGRTTLIDLWTKTPTTVAEVKGCIDARSVDGSKHAGSGAEGFEDKFIIEGCYWPMQYVIFDGLTLEPLQVHKIPTESIDGEQLDEVRIAAIVASHNDPVWAVGLKESGYVAIIDYSKPDFPITKMIKAQRFLHDGGFDKTGRYFAIAANERNQVAVIDLKTMKRVALINTGAKPHPGRGANWVDPKYGPVMATTHMGEGKLVLYGADPKNHPQHAWKVVREIKLPSAGTLFVKTHDNSPWVWTDATLSTDPKQARSVCVYSKQKAKVHKCWEVSKHGRAVHFEYNKQGTQVWVSNWDNKGELIIYDDKSLKEIKRISGPWVRTPTGKFNVYNTANDVY